ncbi:hypothetical protein [Erythrobacter sanguineus]|uniref:Uncharacterized protein n=2 Tax=Erythrobacter sanguineus TaxID=198312 RepID=A0A1M7RVA9_9SPHN|nr:hypothetical protein [Erythrobacter sanguineus]SHN49942.1 hypothetical protein SAMN02745193_00440 [Erythrobacter sanguineus]
MAHTGTGFFDRKGNFFKSARDATVSDLAGMLGQIGEGESLAPGIAYMLLERRAEIERLFAEHDKMLEEEAVIRGARLAESPDNVAKLGRLNRVSFPGPPQRGSSQRWRVRFSPESSSP